MNEKTSLLGIGSHFSVISFPFPNNFSYSEMNQTHQSTVVELGPHLKHHQSCLTEQQLTDPIGFNKNHKLTKCTHRSDGFKQSNINMEALYRERTPK